MQTQARLASNDKPTTKCPPSEEAGLAYWKSYLDGCSPCHFPSLDAVSAAESGSVPVSIGNSIPKIQSFHDETKISVSTVFQVAWGLILRAYTGQDSVCFGDVKTAPGDADVIGRPIHVGICRIEFSDTVTISEILQTIQAAGIERRAIRHVRWLDVMQSTGISDAPLFNTCMSFPCKERQKPIEEVECDFDNQYSIVVRCKVEGSGMGIALDYQTSVLSEKQAIGIANTFERAVSSLIGKDDQIGQICLLSDVDKSQIYKWNKDPPLRAHCCVDTLIHERCLSQPMAPAVCAWDGEFSYGELEHLSSAAAQHLAALGVCPEFFVPLLFEKSRWVTIAMLGVVKAGGAFVLLDPSHPVARLQSICQSVSARLIVVSAQHAKLAADLATTVVEIGGGEAEWIVDERPPTPSPSATPENALYAVFTSGSTGAPKGIVSEHASFHAAILPYTQAVGLDHESRVFQFCSHAFDVTIFDTLTTLISGGCVCVPSNTDRWSDVENAIQHYRATHAALTPTVARILDPKNLPTLRTLVLGGEKLATTDMAKWVDHLRVVNLYGASECSIMSIQSITGNAPTFRTTDYATGSACWIVDPNDHERLLPIGAIGELVIEGSIVGRGYLGDQEKTATTFIQPPSWLCQLRGRGYRSAVYKSGDLAQYTADGSIRFIGRKDTQVKLRGQRIELGEVEYHVRLLFPSARDVVAEVVTTRDPSRTPMLVAFVGSGNEAEPKSRDHEADSSQILTEPNDWFRSQIPIAKSQLQQSLPSYMVPAVFLPLATLPLTRTAKTDRRLLRELAAGLSREQLESYQFPAGIKRAPLTTIEKLLQQYFARALNIPVAQVGADDHFLHSGGDSLTVMKLVAMARKDKYKLTVQDVFDHPRLSALACVVPLTTSDEEAPPEPFSLVNKQRDIIRAAAQQCHLPVKLIEDVYPCTPLQRGFMSTTMQDSRAFIADLALSLPPDIDLQRLKAAWIAVANANPILRTRMVLSASHGLLQVVIREQIRWTVSENSGAQNLVVDVGKPLVQLVLCCHQKSNQGQLQLLLMIHHAVYDGWTLPLVFAEVEAAYRGSSTLVPHPVSPFIRYLQSIPDGEDYWNPLMENLQTPVFPALPFKTYQPSPNAIMNTTIITLGPSARQFTPSTYVRLAWAIVQARQQGTSDVFFGTVISGRNAPVAGIESMTAPTVATVPCRVTLDLQSPVRSALHKIQDDTITGIPFEQLGLLNIRRLGEHAALACSFQTLLAMQPGVGSSTFSWLEQRESATDYRADATYAINLFGGFEGNELKFTALYDVNVVKEEEMQRMMADFGRDLQALHKSPDSRVQDIISVGE